MPAVAQQSECVRFGPFEADLGHARLSKFGLRVRVETKPWLVLTALLEHPGEVVTREELYKRLWTEGTYVDFDRGLNAAVKKLRRKLSDDSGTPTYIETVHGIGYRFVGTISTIEAVAESADAQIIAHGLQVETAKSRMPMWRLSVATVVVIGAVALGIWIQSRRVSIPLPPGSKKTILIAAFENRTGEEVLNSVLETALQQNLAASNYVSVVSRPRVEDTLALMKKPANLALVEPVAREVSLRDGNTDAYVAGWVGRVGSQYAISLAVMDPHTANPFFTVIESAQNKDDVLPAMSRLAVKLREGMGEEWKKKDTNADKLLPVSTRSLAALQLYSRAEPLLGGDLGQMNEATELLKQAVAADPDFASAHIMLAHSLSNLDRGDEAAPFYQRAMALANTVPERERLFIEGSYYQRFKIDPPLAIEKFRASVTIYPGDHWAESNLLGLLRNTAEKEEYLTTLVGIADSRPNSFSWNLRAARDLRNARDRRSAFYYGRAKALYTPNQATQAPGEAVDFLFFNEESAVLRRDWRLGNAEVQRLAKGTPAAPGEYRDEYLDAIETALYEFGRLREFRELGQGSPMLPLIEVEYYEQRGDAFISPMKTAMQEQLRHPDTIGAGSLRRMLHYGILTPESKSFKNTLNRSDPSYALAAAEVELIHHRPAAAIRLLEAGVRKIRAFNYVPMMQEELAAAYRQQGDVQKEISALEPLLDPTGPLITVESGHALLHLAKLYRQTHQPENAAKVKKLLSEMLEFADPDHPLRTELAREEAAAQASRQLQK